MAATSGDDMKIVVERMGALAAATGDAKKFTASANKKLYTTYLSNDFKGLTTQDIETSCLPKMYLVEKAASGKACKHFTINKANCKLFIEKCADEYIKRKKSDETVEAVTEKMIRCIVDHKAEEKKTKSAAVVNRLTDSKAYTGAHKSRFGEDGKGKGKEGREDIHEHTGYTGEYKNKGTFDAKKK